ncbi:MAG: RecQ family ATP-dependent DNA helicase [Methylobacteriaceae bacterium]|nr:RecQ family ATP-dependent DNA helicase [Methylobacteriaceae bacterium]
MPGLQEARSVLRDRFGHDDFRPGQAEIISAVIDGRDVLAVLPTGSGKSLLYQLPALILPSLTVVVSPLVSLMRDQVQHLAALGIPAATLHSAAEPREIAEVLARLRAGSLKLLYVAPERLDQPGMIAALRAVHPQIMAVDEAHCIAHWGHEFRPEYRNLRKAADAIGVRQIVAVTATAAPPTRAEIIDSLFRAPPQVFAGSFERSNLSHRVERRRAGLRQLQQFLAQHAGKSGIVYCATREKTDRLARQLRDAGFKALPYHAGLDGGTRHAHQDEFITDKGVVMVATIAFGMGIDKADVRFICHVDLPSSMETYYQETGRAGRDGLPAETLLLYTLQDFDARRLQLGSIAESDRQHEAATKLRLIEEFCRASTCRQQILLRALGDGGAPCGRCDNCQRGFMQLRRAAQLPMSGAAYARTRATRFIASLAEARPPAPDDPPADTNGPAPQAPQADRLPTLTIAQERAVLRMKSARLSIAQRRRCAPAHLVPDAVLREVALTGAISPAAIPEAFARHQIRDEPLAQALTEILRNELRNI